MMLIFFQEVLSRKVLVDEGTRQLVEIEQAAIWRFLWFSGTISVHVLVDQNRDDYSVRNNAFFFLLKFIDPFTPTWGYMGYVNG